MSQRTRAGSSSSKGQKNTKDKQVKCVFCPALIDATTHAMSCDSCGNWICLKCAKITPTLYTELMKAEESNANGNSLTWNCTVCKGMASDFGSLNKNILELKRSNDERLSSVENKLSCLETSIKDTVRKEVDMAKVEINESVQKKLSESVGNLVDVRLKEMEESKNLASNLVFFS